VNGHVNGKGVSSLDCLPDMGGLRDCPLKTIATDLGDMEVTDALVAVRVALVRFVCGEPVGQVNHQPVGLWDSG
jgi:hypothetical protein